MSVDWYFPYLVFGVVELNEA